MNRKIMVEQHKFWAVLTTIIAYICWVFIYQHYEDRYNISDAEITMISRVGIFIMVCYFVAWRKLTGEYLTLFNIFLAFYVVFNFGQCLLWAVGIHTDEEIGKALVFHTVSANNNLILRAQLLSIICFITLNCGALLMYSRKRYTNTHLIQHKSSQEDRRLEYLYFTALVLSFVSVPAALYNAINRFVLSQIYSYHDLYYGAAEASANNSIINILSALFLPCLLGLLIGSGYRKKVRRTVYSIFAIYAMMTLLCGDRGEWINMLLILFWAECHFYKKYKTKTILVVCVLGLLSLNVINAVVALRNVGLSWAAFQKELMSEEANPIISMLTEFGKSMGISIILLQRTVVYPYGISYLVAIPTMFGTGPCNALFGTKYVQLGRWFAQTYLGLDYGTDFSIVGEALLNCGVYGAPLVLLIEGIIVATIALMPYKRKQSPLLICLCLGAMPPIIQIARSTLWAVLNSVSFMVIIFSFVYLCMPTFFKWMGKGTTAATR